MDFCPRNTGSLIYTHRRADRISLCSCRHATLTDVPNQTLYNCQSSLLTYDWDCALSQTVDEPAVRLRVCIRLTIGRCRRSPKYHTVYLLGARHAMQAHVELESSCCLTTQAVCWATTPPRIRRLVGFPQSPPTMLRLTRRTKFRSLGMPIFGEVVEVRSWHGFGPAVAFANAFAHVNC